MFNLLVVSLESCLLLVRESGVIWTVRQKYSYAVVPFHWSIGWLCSQLLPCCHLWLRAWLVAMLYLIKGSWNNEKLLTRDSTSLTAFSLRLCGDSSGDHSTRRKYHLETLGLWQLLAVERPPLIDSASCLVLASFSDTFILGHRCSYSPPTVFNYAELLRRSVGQRWHNRASQ